MVKIASAASRPPFSDKRFTISPIPDLSLSIGSCFPITPVELTTTSQGFIDNFFAQHDWVSSALLKPIVPVHAFAFPELIRTALTLFCCLIKFFETTKGAAITLFSVNVPAALHGTSENIKARSFFSFFIPQFIPAALIPITEVTEPLSIN